MRKPHGREWSWVVLVGVALLVAVLALSIYFVSLATKKGRPQSAPCPPSSDAYAESACSVRMTWWSGSGTVETAPTKGCESSTTRNSCAPTRVPMIATIA